MNATTLHRLCGELRRDPARGDAWIELARSTTRTRRLPAGLPRSEVAIPRLLELWSCHPQERSLAGLLLPLLGLEHVPEPYDPGSHWLAAGRVAGSGIDLHDPASGFPLRVRRRADGAEMVLVPAGPFLHGEDPSRPAALPAFLIDRVPVTARRYQRFLLATERREPRAWSSQLERPGRPVVHVRVDDATSYGTFVGARLPTGLEWEKAARGPDGRPFPWGHEAPDPARACFGKQPAHQWNRWLMEVGRHPDGASPFGVLDMAGNVSEWCLRSGIREGSEAAPADLPPRPHEARGGSWTSPPEELRASVRGNWYHPFHASWLGFRLVKPLPIELPADLQPPT